MAEYELRFKSIAFRWFVNVFLIVAAAVTVAAVVFCAVIGSMYVERVEALASDYAYDFSSLSKTNDNTFKNTAVSLSDTFLYKNKIEIHVMDKNGNVIVTTTGFDPLDEDIKLYSNNTYSSGTAFTCENSEGEKVLVCNTEVYDKGGNYLGSYRWITSLKATNRKTLWMMVIIIVIAVGMLGICLVSGLFFIKSIVRPIRVVSSTARKIAMGDFKSQINVEENDEIGELCDTINYMANELSSAEEMKNDFISSVSHELRTPLTAICGWGETVKNAVGTDEALVSRGIDVMLGEADRLSSLVEELLDFSRMQNGKLSVNTRPTDVTSLLTSAADMYTELAKQQGIELAYTRPNFDAVVMGDPDRLKQVFINIIDNAVKYTESGGQVLVMEALEEGCVRIVVEDTGVGIPEQDLDRVKEKFFKSNKTVRGSGIGLAVADEIIKQHQGLLFLHSVETVGTTVTIVLPLYEEVLQQQEVIDEVSLAEIADSAILAETSTETKGAPAVTEETEERKMTAEEMVAEMKSYPELTEEQLKMFGPDAKLELKEEPEHLEDISPEELAELEEELRAEAEKAAELNIPEGTELRTQGDNNG